MWTGGTTDASHNGGGGSGSGTAESAVLAKPSDIGTITDTTHTPPPQIEQREPQAFRLDRDDTGMSGSKWGTPAVRGVEYYMVLPDHAEEGRMATLSEDVVIASQFTSRHGCQLGSQHCCWILALLGTWHVTCG